MKEDFAFLLKQVRFDESYRPSDSTRLTTNFANLARGASRQDNLRNTLKMIDNRFNSLACRDNPARDRYAVDIDIISVEMDMGAGDAADVFPLIEILKTRIHDRHTGRCIDGMVGNNFSSYVRDYDFSVLLPEFNEDRAAFGVPEDFGDLHGKLFRSFVNSEVYTSRFRKPPVICISASSSKVYRRTEACHPILGVEYRQDESSLTDRYFEQMGLQVRYFMPPGSTAPLAFYASADLLADYTDLELISTISTMETFQKIYRPEIYNANAAAGDIYRPSLVHQDYSLTRIVYDREERSQLALRQGRLAEERFIRPYRGRLAQWAATVRL